jgi:hypothetical protein
VLPAEFQIDPTGFGRMTGLYRPATPPPKAVAASAPAGAAPVARFYPAPYRSDTVEIPLAAGGDSNHADELEYKVRMKAGDSLVYAWAVDGLTDPQMFYYDFHSEAASDKGAPEPKPIEYRQATGLNSNGVLIAPVAGIHGWYLQNQSVKPVVVKLKLSGFYELIPAGQDGNEAGIVANKPVGKAKAP